MGTSKKSRLTQRNKKSNELKSKVIRILDIAKFTYSDINSEDWLDLNKDSEMNITCSKNHTVKVNMMQIIHNNEYNCKKCRADDIAKQRGGECLSETFTRASDELNWKCGYDHTWPATYDNVIGNNSWCPKCKISVGEEITRKLFNVMFGVEFIKKRYDWLKGLELDGYNEFLKLAFEYNGVQHYKFMKHFHKTEDALVSQQTRDKTKYDICVEKGITLIIIPHTVKPIDIQNFIIDECIKNNINIPFSKKLDITTFKDIYKLKDKKFEEAETIVKSHGGIIVDENRVYVGSKHIIKVECKNGHQWDTCLSTLQSNRWCKNCPRAKINTIDTMRQVAIKNNGECLSDEYIDFYTKLLWKCNVCQRSWNTTPRNIMRGNWCGNNCLKSNIDNECTVDK